MTGCWPFLRYVIQTYGVFIGTTLLGFVTAISVVVSNKGVKKERIIKLNETKIKEAYTPFFVRLSKDPNDSPVEHNIFQTEKAIEILHEKDYLFHPDILDSYPKGDITKLRSDEERYRKEWEDFYNAVWDEREKLLKEYLKWMGVKDFEELTRLPPKISFNASPSIPQA